MALPGSVNGHRDRQQNQPPHFRGRQVVKSATCLRAQYAMSGTDVGRAPLSAYRAAADARDMNPYWGYITRAGLNDKSHIMKQIEKHADLYTSRVSNFYRKCQPKKKKKSWKPVSTCRRLRELTKAKKPHRPYKILVSSDPALALIFPATHTGTKAITQLEGYGFLFSICLLSFVLCLVCVSSVETWAHHRNIAKNYEAEEVSVLEAIFNKYDADGDDYGDDHDDAHSDDGGGGGGGDDGDDGDDPRIVLSIITIVINDISITKN
eukprot:3640845-Rhodomonas_salina.2